MASTCAPKFSLLLFVIFVFCKVVNSEEDYYSILGLNRNANNEEIRRAYRRLAREWYVCKFQKKFFYIKDLLKKLWCRIQIAHITYKLNLYKVE